VVASATVISSGDARYYSSAIAYYTGNGEELGKGELPGEWHGSFAETLDLDGAIEHNDKHLDSLMQGKDPATGATLRKGAGTVRTYIDESGVAKEHKSNGAVDMTFSAPKSVSIAAFLGSDEVRLAIESAHRESVKTALNYLEENYAYRRTASGQEKAQIVTGIFQHTDSREGDPQLHSHAVVLNACKGKDSGKTGALNIGTILNAQHKLGEIYRNELQHRLENLGYEARQVQLNRGYSFEITNIGLTKEVTDHFSKRSQAIDQEIELFQDKSRSQAAVDTRQKKEARIDRAASCKRWKEEAKSLGFDLENLKLKRKTLSEKQQEVKKEELEKDVLRTLIRKEAFKAFTEKDVALTVLRQSKGQFSSKDCGQITDQIIKKNLHEIGSNLDRWKRDKEPVRLELKTSKVHTLKRLSSEVRKKLGSAYEAKVSETQSKPVEDKPTPKEKDEKRLYTLNKEGRQKAKDSVYAIGRSKLAPWLQKILPKGQTLSYEYRQKQFEKSKLNYAKKQKRFEKRKKQFKRKMFLAYMKGYISKSKYVQLRDGKKQPKLKLLINLKYLTHNMTKQQKDYLIKKLEKTQSITKEKPPSRFLTAPQKEQPKEKPKEQPKEQSKEKVKDKSKERDR